MGRSGGRNGNRGRKKARGREEELPFSKQEALGFYRRTPEGLRKFARKLLKALTRRRLVWRFRRLGNHLTLVEIARGGMGVVYTAKDLRDLKADRFVALKVILGGQFLTDKDLSRFRNEIAAIRKLKHPNIIRIYDLGESEGLPYYTMRLLEGGDLSQHLHTFKHDPQGAARLVATVARAVHYAHRRGIIHRDLNPGNIVFDAERNPVVIDFGLARLTQRRSDLTLKGVVMGTPAYMAPEQAKGNSNRAGRAADIWSLGVLLYHLLSGRVPFEAEGAGALTRKIIQSRPRRLPPTIDRALRRVCLKCLQKRPQRRYRSAEALAEELEQWLLQERKAGQSKASNRSLGTRRPARARAELAAARFPNASKPASRGHACRSNRSSRAVSGRRRSFAATSWPRFQSESEWYNDGAGKPRSLRTRLEERPNERPTVQFFGFGHSGLWC